MVNRVQAIASLSRSFFTALSGFVLLTFLLFPWDSYLEGAVTGEPPIFVEQPRSQTLTVYTLLSLPTSVVSATPVGVQWWFNGSKIEDELGRSVSGYWIEEVQETNSGSYFCVATNASGATTSLVAVVEVKPPPPTPGSTLDHPEIPYVLGREVFGGGEESDGSILFLQTVSLLAEPTVSSVVRLRPDGSIKEVVRPNGNAFIDARVALHPLPDGRFFFAGARYQHDGTLDDSFKPAVPVAALTLYQSDGGLVTFYRKAQAVCGSPQGFVRLDPDGSLSTTMLPGFNTCPKFPGDARLIPYSGGRMFVYGSVESLLRVSCNGLLLMRSDGMVEPYFAEVQSVSPYKSSFPTLASTFKTLWPRPDGRLVILVWESRTNSLLLGGLQPDGTLDPTLPPTVVPGQTFYAGALQADGKLVLAVTDTRLFKDENVHLIRIQQDGTLDATLATTIHFLHGAIPSLHQLRILRDGNILVMGSFSRVNNYPRRSIALVRGGPFAAPQALPSTTISVERGREFILTGHEPEPLPTMYQWFRDGELLSGETNSLLRPIPSSVRPGTSDFSLLASNALGSFSQRVAQVTITPPSPRAGTVDPTFHSDNLIGYPSRPVLRILEDSRGNIIVGGWILGFTDPILNGLARLTPSGVLDKSFSPVLAPGFNHSEAASGITALPDGGLIVGAGQSGIFPPIREVRPDGTEGWMPTRFESGSLLGISPIHSVVSLGEGGQGGYVFFHPGLGVVKLSSDFQLDVKLPSSYYSGPNVLQNPSSYGRSIETGNLVVDSQKRFLLCGFFTGAYGASRNGIVRVGADRELDVTFDAGRIELDHPVGGAALLTRFPSYPQSMRGVAPYPILIAAAGLDSRGRIVVAGSFSSIQGVKRYNVARLLEDGTLDLTFDPGSGSDLPVLDLHVQSDDRVLLGGMFTTVGGLPRRGVARLNQDGSVDPTFDPGTGVYSTEPFAVLSITQQRDGRVLIGGQFTSVDGVPCASIARLLNEPQLHSPQWTPGGLQLSLTSIEGREHRFEYTSSLENPVWKELGRYRASREALTVVDPDAGSGKRFYRVTVE